MRKRIHVAVGVIHRSDGRILIAQRAAAQHLGGLWEFPGGKVESGESVNQALKRELQEELGIEAREQSALCKIRHDYPDKSVLLDVWHVHDFSGEAHGREGQPLRWVMPHELRASDFPDANRAIIRALQLSDFIAIVPGDIQQSEPAIVHSVQQILDDYPRHTLIRLRSGNNLPSSALIDSMSAQGIRLIVDINHTNDFHRQHQRGITGVHVNRHILARLTERPVPDEVLFGASCHNEEELVTAMKVGTDYVLLSPVQTSQSHPDQSGMGWEHFQRLAAKVNCAVYAMGGLQREDLPTARACGARGIAGIGLFRR